MILGTGNEAKSQHFLDIFIVKTVFIYSYTYILGKVFSGLFKYLSKKTLVTCT